MSYDPNADKSPETDFDQPKSKKKFWLFGGVGCVVFLLLCCGGIGAIGYMVAKPLQDIFRESQEYARTSEIVADAVGAPVAVAEQQDPLVPATFTEDGVTIQEWRFAVTGSKTNGQLIVKIAQEQPFKYERKSLALELEDGTVIDLNPEEELDIDIDLGDDLGGDGE